jgi:pimeloyl-ACP methyl ester carboxylesterase
VRCATRWRVFGQTPLPPEGEFSHAEDLLTTLHEPSTLIGASYGGAGHLPSLEKPAETSRLIREFLQEQRI